MAVSRTTNWHFLVRRRREFTSNAYDRWLDGPSYAARADAARDRRRAILENWEPKAPPDGGEFISDQDDQAAHRNLFAAEDRSHPNSVNWGATALCRCDVMQRHFVFSSLGFHISPGNATHAWLSEE